MNVLRHAIVAVCIVLTVQALLVTYSYWRIGTELEAQLVTCIEGS